MVSRKVMATQNVRTGILIILDGFGINPRREHNAIANAQMPNLESVLKKFPHSQLDASESHVGLPNGFMGNSEVGHLNIGAGRVVYQDFSLITHEIETGGFFENPAFLGLFDRMKAEKNAALHLMGLVSDGGVHSHLSHLFALIQLAKRREISKVWIHAFTDGRDTSPNSGLSYVTAVNDYCRDAGCGKIASVEGRFFAMDRDNRWERTEQAYSAIAGAQAPATFSDPTSYIRAQYEAGLSDEFLPPAVASSYPGVKDGDGIIFFNFRADRARQITRAFTETEFSGFRRQNLPTLSGFVGMTPLR